MRGVEELGNALECEGVALVFGRDESPAWVFGIEAGRERGGLLIFDAAKRMWILVRNRIVTHDFQNLEVDTIIVPQDAPKAKHASCGPDLV